MQMKGSLPVAILNNRPTKLFGRAEVYYHSAISNSKGSRSATMRRYFEELVGLKKTELIDLTKLEANCSKLRCFGYFKADVASL